MFGEDANYTVVGLVKIRDKETGEVLRDVTNAIHFGNLASSIAQALSGLENGHIRYMAFGNGGTRISQNGEILYREPQVSLFRDPSSSLYNETYKKEINQSPGNTVVPIIGSSNFTDIKTTVTLDFIETGLVQDSIDRAANVEIEGNTSTANGSAVFDEIALYTGPAGIVGSLTNSSDVLMITHVIFHPIQKSANRILEIDYTIRIQLS
jgi:hypothetical protein